MKEDYYDKAINFDSLYKGLKKSCRNVRWKDSVVGYESEGLLKTLALSTALKEKNYKISKYQTFIIHEPKEREIVAAKLVDRQFQRSLCDNGLYEDITEHFIRDNCACQIGRGTDDALKRLKLHFSRYYRKYGNKGWILKCDIKKFFPSTNHEIAKRIIRKYVSDKKAANAVCDVIDSFNGKQGIGLGSQISQLVELILLNDLDHMIKEKLHIKAYVRYMDDFILIHPNKEYLQYCLKCIKEHLTSLDLELNKKTCIFPIKQGVIFLQWRFILTNIGKVLMLLPRKKITKYKRQLKKVWKEETSGVAYNGITETTLISFLANMKRGNTYYKQRQLISFFNNLTGGCYKNDKKVP